MEDKEFFSQPTIVDHQFAESTVRYHFNEMDSDTDLQYQRRMTKVARLSGGNSDIPDHLLNIEIWLFDRLVTKVERRNGSDDFQPVDDFKRIIPPVHKRRAVSAYWSRIKEAQKDENEGNS